MLKALIVDDEPLAHQVILHHLKKHKDITIIEQCFNATQALTILAKQQIDLLFLDINMPALSGIELLKVLANKPQVIIISAYQEYALEGFDLEVTDYLLKPVPLERFDRALDKVRKRTLVNTRTMELSKPRSLVLNLGREKRKFDLSTVSHFEAYGNYVKVWQSNQAILANTRLKIIREQLSETDFIQVHKSFIINPNFINAVEPQSITLSCGRNIKIGKSFKNMTSSLLSQ